MLHWNVKKKKKNKKQIYHIHFALGDPYYSLELFSWKYLKCKDFTFYILGFCYLGK